MHGYVTYQLIETLACKQYYVPGMLNGRSSKHLIFDIFAGMLTCEPLYLFLYMVQLPPSFHPHPTQRSDKKETKYFALMHAVYPTWDGQQSKP